MVNISHILLIFMLAIIVLFFVIGIVITPTTERTLAEQEKLTDIFSPKGIHGKAGMFMKCIPKPAEYEYQTDMKISVSEPKESVDDLSFVVIVFLDDYTFDLGSREGSDPVIYYPRETEAQLKFVFHSKEMIENKPAHITFWKFTACVEKNVEKKDSHLDLVSACPEEYLYAGFINVSDNRIDNSACTCEGATQSACGTKGLCYWDGKCKNCRFFEKCNELNEEQCTGCLLARENCEWKGKCVLKAEKVSGEIKLDSTEELGDKFCTVNFIVKNNGLAWSESDKVKAIISCAEVQRYFKGYYELEGEESIKDFASCLKSQEADKKGLDGNWKLSLYMNCDEGSETEPCGPDSRLLSQADFRC